MTRVIDPVMKELRETLLLMASRAEAILDKAVRSVTERDGQLADEVAGDDIEIDRLDVEVDAKVLQALALQAPVAADLREVIAAKMIATDLERVGDLARNIAKSGHRLSEHLQTPIPAGLVELGNASREMLRRALNALAEGDSAGARSVIDLDDEIDEAQDEVVRTGLEEIALHPAAASEGVDMILIAKNLERVGDHATNVAESVIMVTEARNVKHASKLGR